jgi:translation initiation factor IF-3
MEVRIISELMINEQIRDKEVRVIGTDGEQLGVMDTKEAKRLAEEAGVDLIKIAPTAKPPVCKIMDYGKYKYEQTRREKENKKKQKTIETKEVRLSPNIDTNDLNTKANMARKFLTKGDKVKVTLRFRGRELAHVNSSKSILDEFAEILSDVAVVDKPAKLEGRSMVMFLTEKR